MVSREVTKTHPSGVCPRFKEDKTFGLAINLFGLHYNPRGWSRPHEFLPERWLEETIDGGMDPEHRVYVCSVRVYCTCVRTASIWLFDYLIGSWMVGWCVMVCECIMGVSGVMYDV